MSWDERFGNINEAGLPDTQEFADAVMEHFSKAYYETLFCGDDEGIEDYRFEAWMSDELVPLVDKVIDEDPKKWIRGWQRLLEAEAKDDLGDHDDQYLGWFKDILTAGNYL
jgi:hypothetical protein